MLRSLFLFAAILSTAFHSLAQDTIPENGVYTKYFHSNGVIASSGYLNEGKPDGYWRTFYSSGQLKSEGNRVNFELEGPWKFYDQEGSLYLIINYQNGLKHGFRKSFEDSTLVSAEYFIQDKKDSISLFYYPTGQVHKKIPFENGKEEGQGFVYREDGTIIELRTYRSGVLVRNQFINKLDELGRKEGRYIEFYPDGTMKWEGYFKQDLKHGYFKYYFEDGTLKTTERYENGVLIEDPKASKIRLLSTFDENGNKTAEGTYRNGIKDGIHRVFNDSGQVVQSFLYSMGTKIAEGVYDEEGRRQGFWKEFYPDGTLMSEGKYENDEKVGTWKYYFEDGRLEQIGAYLKGNPNGAWKWYYPNQQLRKQEEWFRGERDGNMIEYDSLGNTLVRGSYREGLPEGRWIITINDLRAQGNYRDGLETGTWEFFYENDQLMYKGDFIDGVANGRHSKYYFNGQVKEQGNYDYGVKIGTWTRYKENGDVLLTITYNSGEEVGYDGVEVSERALRDPVN